MRDRQILLIKIRPRLCGGAGSHPTPDSSKYSSPGLRTPGATTPGLWSNLILYLVHSHRPHHSRVHDDLAMAMAADAFRQ